MEQEFYIERVKFDTRTVGSLLDADRNVLAKTLELPWKDNARKISCIPNGRYWVTKEKPIPKDDPATDIDESGGRIYRPYWHFRLHSVPNRSGILIHTGVKPSHSQGCILVGTAFINTEKEETMVVVNSGKALKRLVEIMPKGFWLTFRDKV